MTKTDIENILLASLGNGRVNIEVDPTHINTTINLSLLWLSAIAPKTYSVSLISNGEGKFDLSDLGADIVVFDVIKSGNAKTDFAIDPFNFSNYVFNSSIDLVDVSIFQNYIETVNKTLGKEFSWKFEYPFLYVSQSFPGEILEIKYIRPYQYVEEIPIKFLPAFIKYAKAELKEILGRIRGKYKGMPAPEGTIEMDAEELISEAQTEKQEAIEDIKKLQPAGRFIIG